MIHLPASREQNDKIMTSPPWTVKRPLLARASSTAAVAAALRKAEAERVDQEKAREEELKKLALENKKLLQQVEKLKTQLRAAVVAKQHAVHEAELRVTDHFRKKLAAAAKESKRDPLKTVS